MAEELAKAIDPDGTIFEQKTIDLSQLDDNTGRLINEFTKIAQINIGGKTPFIIWDECDSVLDRDQCGWLKFFLMPMEKGTFHDGKESLGLGKCVFVFSGGTFEKYEKFKEWVEKENSKRLKGPDFHSRLERVLQLPLCEFDTKHQIKLAVSDPAKLLRANLIRSFLEKDTKVRKVELAVIAYLSHVPLRHGSRSLRQIIQASALDRTDRFGLIHLPSENVLKLHTKSDDSTGMDVVHPRFFVQRLAYEANLTIHQDAVELLWRD